MHKNLQNAGFNWFYSQDESTAVKGCFHSDGKLFADTRMVDFFDRDINTTDLAETLKKIQGSFALIKETNDCIIAAVDRVRGLPLFYRIIDGRLNISDDAHKLLKKTDCFDEQAKFEFILFGYVLGKNTLVQDIKQLQAGEMLVFDKISQKLELIRYYEFRPFLSKLDLNENELIEHLDKLHNDVFKQLIKSCNGRQIVIPLSGGYDSRVIAAMLKRFNYDNVICFSYGRKKHWESEISRKVAQTLGFKWVFCEHTRKDWYNCRYSEQFSKYQRFAGNLTSSAHRQDFLAFENLVGKNLIDRDSVIVPGHTVTFEGTNWNRQLAKAQNFSQSDIFFSIIKKHGLIHNNIQSIIQLVRESIETTLKSNNLENSLNAEKFHQLLELFDWQERQTKYICNSCKVYEFFEHEWRIPLWDGALMNFWALMPIEQCSNKKIFKQCYIKNFPNLINIPVNPPRGKIRRIIDRFKNPRYSQFAKSKYFFSIFTTKFSDTTNDCTLKQFSYIPWHKPIIATGNTTSIAVLTQIKEMKANAAHYFTDAIIDV
jgi:asparagine synthase (glutamine-hydrolysing)